MRAATVFSLAILLATHSAFAWRTDLEPSEFHVFTDKRAQQIDARLLSISDAMTEVRIERRDGQVFEIAATVLSLDDQQFIRDWLYPEPEIPEATQGRLRAFGRMPGDEPVDVSAAEGFDDIVQIGVLKRGWLARRANGEFLAFLPVQQRLSDVADFYANTVWANITKKDGTVWSRTGSQQIPEELTRVRIAAAGAGHSLAILDDGRVRVWGSRYGSGDRLVDPPVPITDAIDVATNQHVAAALTADGTIYCWTTDDEVKVSSFHSGGGFTMIEGGIFQFLGLTEEGEVYEWGGTNLDRAKTPKAIEGEGPFIKVRCGGSTRAAQREDGSWIAWGKNGSGVVDHINQLGPVIDLQIFSEPVEADIGYVVWLEP